MKKSATGFVNLVNPLTRLTGEMSEHGQTRENPPLAGEVAQRAGGVELLSG